MQPPQCYINPIPLTDPAPGAWRADFERLRFLLFIEKFKILCDLRDVHADGFKRYSVKSI